MRNSRLLLVALIPRLMMCSRIMPAPNWRMGETITTSPLSVRRLAASVNLALIIMNATLSPLLGFIEKTLVIAEFDVRKLHHDFTEWSRRDAFCLLGYIRWL